MRILVSNDDGIYAPGLWALVRALRPLGEVVVAAPDREQSGTGASVTLHVPIRAREVTAPEPGGIPTWVVEGTPADCVILALERLVQGPVDLVVAGINQGANLGDDVLISGTVGIALQAYFRGIPAFAISVAALKDVRFEAAALAAPILAKHLHSASAPRPLLLNVNFPNLPLERLRGTSVTRLGNRSYADSVEFGDDGKHGWYWIKRNRPAWDVVKGTDIYAIRHARISLTPLNTELTVDAHLPTLTPLGRWVSRTLSKNRRSPVARQPPRRNATARKPAVGGPSPTATT